MPVFSPLVDLSGFRIDPPPDPPPLKSRQRRCPNCTDADFDVTWWGDRTCFVCGLPVGLPAE